MGNASSTPENVNTMSVIKTNDNEINGVSVVYDKSDENELINKIKAVLDINTEISEESNWKKDDKFKTADGREGVVNFKRMEPFYSNKNYYNVTVDGVTETLYPASDMFDHLSKEERIKVNKEVHEKEIQKLLDDELDKKLKIVSIESDNKK